MHAQRPQPRTRRGVVFGSPGEWPFSTGWQHTSQVQFRFLVLAIPVVCVAAPSRRPCWLQYVCSSWVVTCGCALFAVSFLLTRRGAELCVKYALCARSQQCVKGRRRRMRRRPWFLVRHACLELCQLMPAGWPCQVGAGLLGLFVNSLVHHRVLSSALRRGERGYKSLLEDNHQ